MTVTEKQQRKRINATGFANPLTHDVYLESSAHLKVYADDTLLAIGTDYTVSETMNPAGYEVDIVIPDPGSEPAWWDPAYFILSVEPPIEQADDVSLGGQFGLRFELSLDNLARRVQHLADRTLRALKMPRTTSTAVEYEVPAPVANKVIGWNADADGLELYDNLDSVAADAAASAAAADASADEAAATAVSVAASVAAAAASAAAALVSENAADASADASAGYAVTSDASADAAALSAIAAAASAADADADRITVAADKATVAADKATVAADKATVAADKATTSGYKTDAQTAQSAAVVAQLAAEAALAATLSAYDSFDDRYLGAKAADPTLDNDGNALAAGMIYYNSVSGAMLVYTGSAWVAAYVSGAGYLAAANNLSDVASPATARTNLGLAIGSNVQAYDTDLTAIAALTSAANKMPYATGAGTWALADLTAAGRAILDDASADAQLVTLGGSAAGLDGFKFDFDTVALLIADTVRTYSNTTAGDYIRTRAEGMSFLVAASGASDHITVTAGGLKLYFSGDVEPIAPENALRTGESISVDAGPAIRRILAAGNPLLLNDGKTYVVSYDPASTLGGGAYGYSILVPDNAVIFANGGLIKQADDAPDWCRTVSFNGTSGFMVFGALRVDANVENVTGGNEHMHGVFLYNSSDFYIEAIESWSARGDNVYIGGTSNTRGTCDGYIGRIVGTKAGRKNLVGQAFDNLHIGSASLDNTAGGATLFAGTPDATDGDCLDIEPDSFDGSVPNRITIDYLKTKGAGNDFAAGTTAAVADAMVVTIGKWDNEIVSRSGVPWHTHYGVTLNIGDWNVWGVTSTSSTAPLYYSCRLNVGTAKISAVMASATTNILEMSPVSGDQPRISFDNLTITGTGQGIENKDGILDIGKYIARTSGIAFRTRGLGSAAVYAETSIDFLDLLDVGVPGGASYAVLVNHTGTAVSKTRIGHLKHRDTRGSKNARVIYLGAGASPGLVIGSIDDDGTNVAIIAGDGPDKFYRSAGGGKGPGDFMCIGTPEAQITAPIGSIARRIDGGASTAMYVKESGTGNTGWTAMLPVPLTGTATYNPASLADGAGATTTVTVTGAALGDIASASFSLDLQGITLTAWVSATNTVSVRFQNESGGVLDLASGTLKARVMK